MRSLFISPHDDDQALFGAFTCMRNHPDVLVVLDSYIQPNRGEVGCSAERRAWETEQANMILGCKTLRLGLCDDIATEDDIDYKLSMFQGDYDIVYAPALQGGNIHHDMVNRSVRRVFGEKVVEYTTYTKTELYTRGVFAIHPTNLEGTLKNQALACYVSQWRINKPHFDAVIGTPEWLC